MLTMNRFEAYINDPGSPGLWLGQIGDGSTLAGAFQDFYRSAIETVPQFMAAFLVLLVFALAALIAWQATRAAVARINIPMRICFLLARLAFVGVLAPGVVIALAIATGASFGRVFTGFGLLSVGIGFALKNPLENMVSGVLTILTGPFRIGDEIEVGGYEGSVEAINIHDTVLKTFDGKRVSIPNRDVYISAVVDQTAQEKRRYDVVVGVHYNDDLAKAQEVALNTLRSIPGVRPSPEPVVLVSEFGESSVNLILRFWSDPTQQDANRITSIVTARTKEAFDAAGITIPFPIRTLHLPNGVSGANGAEKER